MGSSSAHMGEVQVFFQSRRAGLEAHLAAHLAEFIVQTKETLDVAAYDLRYPEMLDALTRLVASGKKLRIAYDSGREHVGGLMGDPKPNGTYDALQAAGLLAHATPIHHGRHLMHDKFLVRDGTTVWTGSANFTSGGLELQDNNCLIIASRAVAQAYTTAFESLLEDDESIRPASVGTIPLAEGSVRPFFAPASGERIEDAIVALLANAQRVRVLAFLLSDPGILEAMLPMGRDHTYDIRGIYDPHGMANVLRYTQQAETHFWFMHDPRFVAAPTHAFTPHAEQDFMHNKVLIVDDRYVVTGSYNFSENAESNDENLLILDSPALAAQYTTYFDRLAATYTKHGAHASTPVLPHGQSHSVASAVPQPMHGATETVGETVGAPVATGVLARSATAEKETRMISDPNTSTPRPRVLQWRPPIHELIFANSQQQLLNEQVAGTTQHAVVYTDGTPAGDAAAQAVLDSFEADYQQIATWFGGIQLPPGQDGDDQTVARTALPIYVAMDPNSGGAYHYGCSATDIYIEPIPGQASGLVTAEVVEIFEAAINNGWDCGFTNGESLSRVLAAERDSALGPLLAQTAEMWWFNGATDYVNTNQAYDTNQDANGCGSLFLYYLHSQLNFTWTQIATAGGATLGECYQRLTGQDPLTGFADFTSRLSAIASGGQLPIPQSGNPFPIQAQGQPVQPMIPVAGIPVMPAMPVMSIAPDVTASPNSTSSPAQAPSAETPAATHTPATPPAPTPPAPAASTTPAPNTPASPGSAAAPSASRGGLGAGITTLIVLIVLVLIALGIALVIAIG